MGTNTVLKSWNAKGHLRPGGTFIVYPSLLAPLATPLPPRYLLFCVRQTGQTDKPQRQMLFGLVTHSVTSPKSVCVLVSYALSELCAKRRPLLGSSRNASPLRDDPNNSCIA